MVSGLSVSGIREDQQDRPGGCSCHTATLLYTRVTRQTLSELTAATWILLPRRPRFPAENYDGPHVIIAAKDVAEL
jgi:hypothetical protein